MIPRATYRIQFHSGFTFADAAPLASYLASLGISHLYSSPITTARTGSTHGYDVVDPTRINPELGGEDGFRALVAALRGQGLGVILDIVPNHMAVGGSDNEWWMDVLANGEASRYASFFDIDWHPADPALHGKLLAPFLGAPYAEVLASGDLKLDYEPARDRLSVLAYGQHRFPIRPADYGEVLGGGDPAAAMARYDPASDEGRQRLHDLLERQHYRLAWWRVAGDEINWRRFFDVTELAGIRIERDEVFEAVHGKVFQLYREGLIDGVRVDHVDGLADPAAYCRKLRERLDELAKDRPADAPPGPAYFVVEKILAPDEQMPRRWLTDGTTGYEYMNESAALLHAPEGEAALTSYWAELSGRPAEFEAEERDARIEILTRNFSGQLAAAAAAFQAVAASDLATRDVPAGALRRALIEMLAAFPAYRTYGTGEEAPQRDEAKLEKAVASAKAHGAAGEDMVVDLIANWIRGEGPGDLELRKEAVRRFQQLSAPVSAKAVEDTAFYRYLRLISRNDVGFDPGRLSAPVAHFHKANLERAASFPHSMVTTATHDHKRGEDVRARLAVLSEFAEGWVARAKAWRERNEALSDGIDPADEYQLYQTLVGAWPLHTTWGDAACMAEFADRVAGWQRKALREAKLRSSWAAPDEAYEAGCEEFLRALLDPSRSTPFLNELSRFVDEIAPAGALNGIVQAVLRCTVPGVPDLYQGAEYWDLSLVDPDNRRPVDFDRRQATLAGPADTTALIDQWRNGALKQSLLAQALRLRRDHEALFAEGSYEPVELHGPRAEHAIAFVRRHDGLAVLVAAALRCGHAVAGRATPTVPSEWWGDTALSVDGKQIGCAELFAPLPVALRVI